MCTSNILAAGGWFIFPNPLIQIPALILTVAVIVWFVRYRSKQR